MNLLPTTLHFSSSWSWLFPRRRRLDDEEQGSFGEFSDEEETIARAIPLSIEVEPDATQMQAVAEQSSCSISRPMVDESESGSSIMFYAVPIILVVAGILLSLHLFEVI